LGSNRVGKNKNFSLLLLDGYILGNLLIWQTQALERESIKGITKLSEGNKMR
jgi:hypothetical protein